MNVETQTSVYTPTHLTKGVRASQHGLVHALSYHKECLAIALERQWMGKASAHERCVKWLTLALDEEQNGLVVTRELHIGFYLNEQVSLHSLLGISEQSAAEYHASVLELCEQQVAGLHNAQ